MNIDAETIERFKSKNYEYKICLWTYIFNKFQKYTIFGYVILFIVGAIYLLWTLSEKISEFFQSYTSGVEGVVSILIAIVICFIFGVPSFGWIYYFRDNIRINSNGIYYKEFKEKFIQWHEIENVRQTLFKICILILKDKNIFKRYIFFNLSHGFITLIWCKEIDEVCKFIKFKIMESKEEI
jgi:hypothetical protein